MRQVCCSIIRHWSSRKGVENYFWLIGIILMYFDKHKCIFVKMIKLQYEQNKNIIGNLRSMKFINLLHFIYTKTIDFPTFLYVFQQLQYFLQHINIHLRINDVSTCFYYPSSRVYDSYFRFSFYFPFSFCFYFYFYCDFGF